MKKLIALALGAVITATAFGTSAQATEPAVRPQDGKTVFEGNRRRGRGGRGGRGHRGGVWFGFSGRPAPRSYYYAPPPVYYAPPPPPPVYYVPAPTPCYGGAVIVR